MPPEWWSCLTLHLGACSVLRHHRTTDTHEQKRKIFWAFDLRSLVRICLCCCLLLHTPWYLWPCLQTVATPDLGWSDREEGMSVVALGLASFGQMGRGMPMHSLCVSRMFFTLWLIWKIVGDVRVCSCYNKQHDRNSFRRRVVISTSQYIIKGSWGRGSHWESGGRTEQRLWRDAAHCLALSSHSATFFM